MKQQTLGQIVLALACCISNRLNLLEIRSTAWETCWFCFPIFTRTIKKRVIIF